MQPRTLEQIVSELNTVYQPQIANIEAQRALIPQQTEANIKAAEAAQTKAYQDILTGAQRRGIGFSGIPLGEQAQYASNIFAPAVLSARATGQSQALSLQDALNQIYERQRTQAEQIRQYETSLAEQQRQFNAQLAKSGSGGGSSTDNATLNALLSYLTGGKTNDSTTNRPSLSSIFGTPPAQATQPQIRVTTPSQATTLQPASNVRLQPSGSLPLQSGGVNLQASGLRLQGNIPLATTGLRVR